MRFFYKSCFILFWCLICCSQVTTAQVTVGTDTNEAQAYPFEPFYAYTYAQNIYLASEINATGSITSLSYYFSGTSTLTNSQDIVIYIGHSTKTAFASTTDWEPIGNLTQVYAGGINVSGGVGWVTLTLNTPFAYNGTDNLIVAFEENSADYDNSADDFHCTNMGTTRGIHYRNDNTNPNPNTPPTATSTTSYVANTIFGGITQACPNPSEVTVSGITASAATFTWVENGSATLWDLELVNTTLGQVATGTPTYTGVSSPYNAAALSAASDYEVYVRSDCSAETSGWIGPINFTTLCGAVGIPYKQSFNLDATPNCWDNTGPELWVFSNQAESTADYGADNIDDATGNAGFFAMVDGSGSGDVVGITLTSPLIDISTATVPTLSFKLFSNNINDGANNLLNVDVWDGANWNNVFSNQSNLGSDWVEYFISLTSLTITGDIQVRFVVDEDDTGGFAFENDILLDDICVDEAPSCLSPIANYSIIEDCVNGFSVQVDITNIGDASTFDITDGTTTLVTGVGLGTTTVGPFPNGIPVDITLVHDADPSCNLTEVGLSDSGSCITVTCGTPFSQSYCYTDNDTQTFLYASSNGSPLLIDFIAGGIESCCDEIFIYDGSDNTAPLLYTFTGVSDISGVSVTSTSPNIFIEINSDGSVSCDASSTCCGTPWDWTINCLDCQFPQANVTINEDCNLGFTVNVNVTSLGDAASLNLLDGAAVLASGVGLGTTTLGPFVNNTIIDLIVAHDSDAVCNLNFPNQTNSTVCPVIEDVTCGSPALNQTYCYKDNDLLTWLYTATNPTATLDLTFASGGIENGNDVVIIYDGIDATAPVLYNGSNGGDLAGLMVSSTGANLFMDITTNGSNSCASGGTCCGTQWNWDVECIGGCDLPMGTATYDCATDEITLNISTTGMSTGGGSYNASIDGTGASQTINTTGAYSAFSTLTPDQTYNMVFDDGAGCVTQIPYIYGGCRTLGNNCTSIIANGDFETSSGWSESAVDGNSINVLAQPLIRNEFPLAGTNSVAFGGFGGSGTSTGEPYTSILSRNVFIPSGNTVTLYIWLLADACASTDAFTFSVDGTAAFTLNGTAASCGENKWREYAIDLTAYADGMTHALEFKLIENSTTPTRIYMDDLLLEGCTPFTCPTQYNGIAGTPADGTDYETDGIIFSIQTIAAGTSVDYDSGTEITLGFVGATFEVQLGATFCAFIDGCNGTGGTVNPLGEDDTPLSSLQKEDKPVKKEENVENINSLNEK